ncbi:MAG: BACON domain-containing protein [Bacteroidales bacterium]|nr:BACON domain-containing protein [Bacteroidales bacterium]
MKQFLPILALLALICACNPDQPEDDNGGGNKGPLSLSAEKMVFSSWGGERSVDVTSPKGKWSADVASDSREWISVVTSVGSGMSLTTKADGSTLTIRVSQNESDNSRTGTVTVSAEGKTVTLTVTQDGREETTADEEETSVSYTLYDGVSIAPKAMAQYITSIDKDAKTFVIDKDIPAELLPSPGKLIINTPTKVLPQGLLANVQTITQTAAGYNVYYSDLPLEQIFKNLSINSEGLDIGGYVNEIRDPDGNPVEFTTTKAAGHKKFHVEVTYPIDIKFITIQPKMIMDIVLKMQMIVYDGKLSNLDFKVDNDIKYGVDYILDVSVGPDEPWTWPVYTIICGAIPVGPVLLTPKIDIYLIANASGSFSFTASEVKEMQTMAYLHYDAIGGLSCKTDKTDPQEIKTKYEAGAKMEASAGIGFGLSAGMGIYGDLVSVGMGAEAMVTGSLSAPIDLEAWKASSPENLIGHTLAGMEFGVALNLNGTASISALGYTGTARSPSVSVDLKKYKVFPPVNEDNFSIVQDSGTEFTFQTYVDEPSLLSGVQGSKMGELVLLYSNGASPVGNMSWSSFNITQDMVDKFWEDPDVLMNIEAKMSGLTPGQKYYCEYGWKIGNTLIPFSKRGMHVLALKSEDVQDIRGILRDIKACASGEWEGCNWDQNVAVTALKNVNVYTPQAESTDKRLWVDVTIPEEWKFGSTLSIGSHSTGNNIMCHIIIKGKNRHFDTISQLDKGCYFGEFEEGAETRVFTYRGISRSIGPLVTEKMDMSYSGGASWGDDNCPSTILADNLTNLDDESWWGITVPKGKSLNVLSLKNNVCKRFELLVYGSITRAAIAALSDVTSIDNMVVLDAYGTSSISVGSGPTYVKAKDVGTVIVSDASNVWKIEIGTGVSSLTISNCPKLEYLIARDGDLTSFSIAKPLSQYLSGDITNQKKLKGVIPSSWSGIRLYYDHRYEYAIVGYNERPYGSGWVLIEKVSNIDETTGEELGSSWWYKDNGYGWYSPGEPLNRGKE